MEGGGEDLISPSQHKRTRTDDALFDKLQAVQVTNSESDSPPLTTVSSSMSYASILLNPLSNYGTAAIDDVEFSEDDCVYATAKSGPSISFSERVKDKINWDWRCAVIIKLVGKPNTTNALKFMSDSLRRKWKLQGPWQLIDLPNDYFVVKFQLHEDMNTALCGGPWIIAGQTLVVQQWKPEFNPFSNEITTMSVWVRIVGLPLRFYKEFTMRKIGRIIGSVIKIDKLTLSQIRGQFGRLCVEIDLQKPLIPYIVVEGETYGVVYEGISMICFNCGCFGHVKANCVYQKQESPSSEVTIDKQVDPNLASNDKMNMDSEIGEIHHTTPEPCKNELPPGGHGPWMLMAYKNKKRDNSASGNAKGQTGSGSRFSVLENKTENEEAEGIIGATNMESPVVPMVTRPKENEPKIVTLWKQVQKKIQTRSPIDSMTGTQKTSHDPQASTSSGFKAANGQPMTDITNGKPAGKGRFSLQTPNKPRKSGVGVKGLKTSTSNSLTFSIPGPDLSPLTSDFHINPPSHNTSANYGHCPPENGSIVSFGKAGTTLVSPSNDQVAADFASTILQQVAELPDMVQSMEPSVDEVSTDADMFPSSEENMNVS